MKSMFVKDWLLIHRERELITRSGLVAWLLEESRLLAKQGASRP